MCNLLISTLGLEAIRDYLEPMWRGMKEFKNRKLLDKIKVEGSKGYRVRN